MSIYAFLNNSDFHQRVKKCCQGQPWKSLLTVYEEVGYVFSL